MSVTSSETYVSFHLEDRVGTILLQRPPVNVINDELIEHLEIALDKAVEAAVTVVRLRSATRAFCAGADLKMVSGRVGRAEGAAAMEATVRRFHKTFDRIASLPAVTVAEIGGVALGGGFELALACDLRLVAADARLGLPEPGVGLLPGAGGTQRLTRLCGAGTAARIILAGDWLDGAEAVRLGIAQWCVPPEDLEAHGRTIAHRIESLPAESLRLSKRCIELAGLPGPGGADAEIAAIAKLMMSAEARDRISAFLTR